jgi:two-component system KDP operon response regulator KdpE
MHNMISDGDYTSAKILLIDDDINILRTLRQNLIDCGYHVSIAIDDYDVLVFSSNNYPDLILLNLHFSTPNGNGLSLCDELRKNNHCPIIVLSKAGAEEEKIKALDMGADDCLDLPVNMEEFLAHVRSALRRWMNYSTTSLQRGVSILCGDLAIHFNSREVILRGEPVQLTPTEFELLKYLAEHRGNVVTHSELSKAICSTEFTSRRKYLRVYISQLRHKIEASSLNPYYILTEPGVGYRFRSEPS